MTPLHTIRRLTTAAALALTLSAGAQAAPLYSNGTVVGGDGLSVLVTPNGTFGFGAQTSANNRVAEDFSVPVGSTWDVTSLSLFAYQTGASTFTFTDATWQIITGDLNGGSVVATGTTAVTDEGLVGHRVLDSALALTHRPIFQMGVDIPDLQLMSGSYWLTWSIGGSLASGPWVPPAALTQDGNAAQSPNGAAFLRLVDGGSQVRVELPFSINGSAATVPEPTSLALVLAAALGAAAAARRRAG